MPSFSNAEKVIKKNRLGMLGVIDTEHGAYQPV